MDQARNLSKMTKEEKKINKKINKARHTMFKRDKVFLSNDPTLHLVVANGGLDNNINREDLRHVFQPYGEIINITMEIGKSYSFVSFSTIEDTQTAMKCVHGKEIKPAQGVVPAVHFYLNFVTQVPGVNVPDSKLPPGLTLLKSYVSEDEENFMLQSVDWEAKDAQSSAEGKDNLKHRKVKHYGYEFLYGINNVDRNRPLEHSVPAWCGLVTDRLLKEGHISDPPDQLTVNQYLPGQGIPAHVDTHSAFEDGICILSLGSEIVMDFKHPNGEHRAVVLPRRSMAVLQHESRYQWTHGITPRKSDIVSTADHPGGLTLRHRETRTSFTFRKILHSPCQCKFPEQCDSRNYSSKEKECSMDDQSPQLPTSATEAEVMEAEHVHKVYEEIASHFSETRHSPWPQVADFLKQQPEGSLITDVGCGNGKYLAVNSFAFQVGCDRSVNLCSICHDRGFPVFVCDCLKVPVRDNSQDTVLSIAVIHHLSTKERRLAAIGELVRILRTGGKGLIYVWALEQLRHNVKSKYLKGKKQGTDDVKGEVIKQNETEYSLREDGDEVKDSDNTQASHGTSSGASNEMLSDALHHKLTVHTNRTQFEAQDLFVPWHLKDKTQKAEQSQCFLRYIHVFQEGELQELMSNFPNTKIVKSYYDQGNWCVIFEKIL